VSAEILRCPQCGGAVAATNHACEFCSAQLLVRACPRCLARVFHGHKHCPHCGATTGDVAAGADRGERACPRCAARLVARAVGDLTVDDCPGCAGVFIDAAAIEQLLADRAEARADAVLGAYRGQARASDTTTRGGKLYVKCPICSTVMNRKQFARGAGVVLDVCRGHGTWFDAGELPVVVDFVRNGGLGRAEKADLAEQREAVRRAAASVRGGVIADPGPIGTVDGGTALIDLLFTLWR
jgi:Zn-finger nucleic acid-binding protein